jgi:DNA-binding MurR/RpiR family transcriptional regulator
MRPNEHVVEAPDTVQRLLHASRVGDAMTARLAAWLLEKRGQIVDLPISRFAQETGVTETTIVRFCKAVGYSGYRELRLALVQSVGIAKGLQLGAEERKIPESGDGSMLSLARKIVATNTDVLMRTSRLLDEQSLERAIEALLKGTEIYLVGFGSSTPVALDLYQRLLRLRVRASICSDPHILTVITTNLDPRAVLFGITYSGQSRDLVDALKAAKTKKATTVVLTSNGGATAARLADILLISAVQPEMAARETVATRISQLAIVDILCTALTLKGRKGDSAETDPFEKEITRVRTEEG